MGDRTPKSRVGFWRAKLDGNRDRDARNLRKLQRLGWRVLVIWECQIADFDRLAKRIEGFLSR